MYFFWEKKKRSTVKQYPHGRKTFINLLSESSFQAGEKYCCFSLWGQESLTLKQSARENATERSQIVDIRMLLKELKCSRDFKQVTVYTCVLPVAKLHCMTWLLMKIRFCAWTGQKQG